MYTLANNEHIPADHLAFDNGNNEPLVFEFFSNGNNKSTSKSTNKIFLYFALLAIILAITCVVGYKYYKKSAINFVGYKLYK